MTIRYFRIVVCFVLLIALLLTACQSPTPPTTAPDTTEPTIQPENSNDNQAVTEEPVATDEPAVEPTAEPVESTGTVSAGLVLDPVAMSAEDAAQFAPLLYNTLVTLEEDGVTPAPGIAESWVTSDDGLDYIFNLRSGLTFHNGDPVDADAVIANFNRWFDPESPLRFSDEYPAWLEAFGGFAGELDDAGTPRSSFDGIEKVDNLTVLVHLNRPDDTLLVNLANPAFSIVSPAALEAAGDDFGTPAGGAVGTGPYMVSEWTAEGLVLAPNPNFLGEVPTDTLEFSVE